MKSRKVIFFILAVLLAAVSCDSDKELSSLSLGKSRVDLSKGSIFITLVTEGPWTLSVEYEGSQRGWIRINRPSGTGSTNSVILAYDRNDDYDPRHAIITADFQGYKMTAYFTQTGLSAVVNDAPRGWMELPATDTERPGFTWTYHNMELTAGIPVRNFSLYYSHEDKIAHWVAYPMNQGLIGTGGRTNEWGYDPNIPEEDQAALVLGSYSGPYDRGHQLPSADRLRRDANIQTFYSTNMTPQRSDFNQNVWGVLEGKVRTWMSAFDTLYVVTGCVPSEDNFTRDRQQKEINIPAAYYKALLGYKKATSDSKEKYYGIAVYLDHDTPGETQLSKSMAMSIRTLEDKLGMNFFVNLPEEFSSAETTISDKFPF